MVQDRPLLRIHSERGPLDNGDAPLNATRQAEGCVGLEVRRVAPHLVLRRAGPLQRLLTYPASTASQARKRSWSGMWASRA